MSCHHESDLIMDVFFSGKYTIHLGLQGSNLAPCTNEALDSALDTVGDKMKAAGYDTHLIGMLYPLHDQ